VTRSSMTTTFGMGAGARQSDLASRQRFDKSADWLSLAESGIPIKQKVKSCSFS
jgi:hypothetical protein